MPTYKQHVRKIKNYGLTTGLARAFSTVPAGVGSIIDAALGLKGGSKRFSYQESAYGPFALLFSAPFAAVGAGVGFLAKALLRIPSLLAHGASLLVTGVARLLTLSPGGKKNEGRDAETGSFTHFHRWTEEWSKKRCKERRIPHSSSMNSPLGFALYFLSEVLANTALTLLAYPLAAVRVVLDSLAGGITSFYAGVARYGRKLFGKESNAEASDEAAIDSYLADSSVNDATNAQRQEAAPSKGSESKSEVVDAPEQEEVAREDSQGEVSDPIEVEDPAPAQSDELKKISKERGAAQSEFFSDPSSNVIPSESNEAETVSHKIPSVGK